MADSLLILDEPRLLQLMQNAEARNAFPFLAAAQARASEPAPAATCCKGKKNRGNTSTKSQELASVKRAISTLKPERLVVLKRLLGSPRQVLLTYSNGRGKTTRFRF
jgi:hypothetical protein